MENVFATFVGFPPTFSHYGVPLAFVKFVNIFAPKAVSADGWLGVFLNEIYVTIAYFGMPFDLWLGHIGRQAESKLWLLVERGGLLGMRLGN
jgi:hypothetical protein